MKIISTQQPYATLMIIGAKRIETRSWSSDYRGTLGIHASKSIPKDNLELCLTEPFKSVLAAAGYHVTPTGKRGKLEHNFPVGALLGIVQMVGCHGTVKLKAALTNISMGFPPHELAFGWYEDGRYGFVTACVRQLVEPIAMVGQLGFYDREIDPERLIFK